MERLEEIFLLELTEQERLDGANLVTVSCNGHFSPSALSTVTGSIRGWRWAVSLANHMPPRSMVDVRNSSRDLLASLK